MNEGLKYVTSGVNPVLVQRGILRAAEIAADAITAVTTATNTYLF